MSNVPSNTDSSSVSAADLSSLGLANSALTPKKRKGKFARIPKIIKVRGRAKGFERLRDMVLKEWEMLAAVSNPLATLKLVLEIDKHAMFAEIATEKAKGTFNMELWGQFQDYLEGKIELPPGSSIEDPKLEIPATGSMENADGEAEG